MDAKAYPAYWAPAMRDAGYGGEFLCKTGGALEVCTFPKVYL